ncbi:thiamine-phosphate kinase [Kordiimonas marina]|uniref:thiamine-phosphate kinase n=1 Tax=Kordiimonas marina TaxID=2872312 RepID=UPI001FF1A6F3|nr:thiamine-phosphate kinase [Kordiimonas marina]MCJ9430402.1 thiamine-phosphate kinase [Kordiimonas marina]
MAGGHKAHDETLGEFGLIDRYFAPLAGPEGLGLKDDAACLTPTAGTDLVISKDMLLEGVHFLGDDPADSLGHKALAVNLSDLAAKGAVPRHYFLGLALPKGTPADWCAAFAAGLKSLQETSGIVLQGGDTTASRSGIVISVTAVGEVPSGAIIRRSGAQVGDDVYVTGTLGDGALGLLSLQGKIAADEYLTDRYRRPTPRSALGVALRGLAHSAADISDGLIADLGHICEASGLGAQLEQALLPVSAQAQAAVAENPAVKPLIWSGGDDYELVFTAPPAMRAEIAARARAQGVAVTRIGQIEAKKGVRLVDPGGQLVQIGREGYQHF